MFKNGADVLEGLQAVSMIPLNIDWEIVRDYQLMN